MNRDLDMRVGKVLITGATGFVGSEVAARLIAEFGVEKLVFLVRKKPDSENSVFKLRLQEHGLNDSYPQLKFVETNFLDPVKFQESLGSIASELDGAKLQILHMAAIIRARTAEETRAQHRVNVEVTRELIEWAGEHASHFVYMSSVVAFGGSVSKKIRNESDFKNFPWVSNFFSYFESKRRSHIDVLERCRVPATLLCPGIIHGSLEHLKPSRAHLKKLRDGSLNLAPPGGGNIVGLDRVALAVVAALKKNAPQKNRVQLLVDENVVFRDYFARYTRLARGEKAQKIYKIPKILAWMAVAVHVCLSCLGIRVSLLEIIGQGSFYLWFESLDPLPPSRGVDAAIEDSLA